MKRTFSAFFIRFFLAEKNNLLIAVIRRSRWRSSAEWDTLKTHNLWWAKENELSFGVTTKCFLTLLSHVEEAGWRKWDEKCYKETRANLSSIYTLQFLSFHLSSGWRFVSRTLRTRRQHRWHTNRLRSETVSQFMLVRILFLIINSHRWQYYFVLEWK